MFYGLPGSGNYFSCADSCDILSLPYPPGDCESDRKGAEKNNLQEGLEAAQTGPAGKETDRMAVLEVQEEEAVLASC